MSVSAAAGEGRKPSLIMICHLPPPTTGAAMMSQYAVRSPLLREAFDCHVIPIRMAGNVGGLGRLRLSKVAGSLAIHWALLRRLSSRRADAVYITIAIDGCAVLRDYASVLFCRAFGVTPILHMHMRGVQARYRGSRFYRALYRSLFKGAEVIHLSPLLCLDLAGVVPPERLHIVENGVPEPAPEGAGERGRKERAPTVLFLSNLMREKGPLDLLAASRKLSAEGVAHRLVFVGATAEEDVAAAIGAADGVVSRGPLYGAERDAALSEADIFVFPSYYEHECQPLSIIEAMACGLPVVASREGGVPDLVRDGVDGLLFEPRDIEGLAEALRRLLLDAPLRAALGQAGRKSYVETYRIEVFEARFVEMLTRLIARRVEREQAA
jgi:glycosyltransferase involved in cell wall biosynthesis